MPAEHPVSRQELRAQVLRAHQQYISATKKLGLICPGCGQCITGGWDPHEWLVKRSAIPTDLQHLIFVPENVVPVHHECHNNSKALTRKCLVHLVPTVFSAARIGMWYSDLWHVHGLSVPRGILYPPKTLPVSMRLRMFNKGCKILGLEIEDWEVSDGTDIRGAVVQRWAGKTRNVPKVPTKWNGVATSRLYTAMFTGYWMDYLEGVVG